MDEKSKVKKDIGGSLEPPPRKVGISFLACSFRRVGFSQFTEYWLLSHNTREDWNSCQKMSRNPPRLSRKSTLFDPCLLYYLLYLKFASLATTVASNVTYCNLIVNQLRARMKPSIRNCWWNLRHRRCLVLSLVHWHLAVCCFCYLFTWKLVDVYLVSFCRSRIMQQEE